MTSSEAVPNEVDSDPTFPMSLRALQAGDQPISLLMSKALAQPELISLAAGFVDQQTLPQAEFAIAVERVLSDKSSAQAALQYGSTPGYKPLREAILSRFLEADGQTRREEHLHEEQTVITAGSNQMLHLVSESLFDPGDVVLCASPTYFVYLGMLIGLGVRAWGVDSDQDGMIPESLEEQLRRLHAAGWGHRVKAIYVVDYFDNPQGVTLSLERRPKIVEIARHWSRGHRIHVIEDIAYRELRYQGDDLPSLRSFDESGRTVITAGTFSKSFAPGIRLGFGLLPKHLIDPVCALKGNLDFGTANFNQHVMHAIIRDGLYESHVERLRNGYREKLHAMLSAADEHFSGIDGVQWVRPTGGLYVWLTLPEHVDSGPESELFRLALDEGMLYVPGRYCFPAEPVPPRRQTIRLSFGVQSPERIREGMAMLSRALRRVLEA
jgi:2-aminoadipate transaminase